MLELLFAILLGLVGGMGRALLGGGLVKPSKTEDESGRVIYDPGFLGTLGVSVVAGLLAWFLNADASFVDHEIDIRPLASALLAGAAGDIALAYYVNGQYNSATTEQVSSATEDAASAARTLSDELQQTHSRERELQERVQELEKELGERNDPAEQQESPRSNGG
jgi:hypothetical protein